MWKVKKQQDGWVVFVGGFLGDLPLTTQWGECVFENEQNALLIAAALNADEKGETLTVVPVNNPKDKAARFDVPEILYSNTRTAFLEPPSEEDIQAFLAREKANPSPQIAEYMNTAHSDGMPEYNPQPASNEDWDKAITALMEQALSELHEEQQKGPLYTVVTDPLWLEELRKAGL